MRLNYTFFIALLCAVSLSITPSLAQQDGPLSPYRSGARSNIAPFYHGVASGDPLSDAVMIWTRITTDSASVDVKWTFATDTAMTNVIDSGMVTTDGSSDFTVKVDVTGLQPNTFYYYDFQAYGVYSVRGRTRTAPVGDVDSLRFAIVSCSSYGHGYFNAYDKIKERNDINAILHLGDYIYEYGDGEYGSARQIQPADDIVSIADYRMRHSHYKLDEDLMRLHQQYPMISVWDDHETANDSWFGGAENHNGSNQGDWFDRKAAGIKAYYEWMPLRMPDAADTQRIYRKFSYGDLLDLYMLDTRLEGREEQDGTNNTASSRTILGSQQFDWLTQNMKNSTAQWQIIGQQVMMAPLDGSPIGTIYLNGDQWDGYQGERLRLYDTLFTHNIQNMVVLTGDIHTSWGNDLPTSSYNSSTGAGSAGVEFVTTSVTSPGLGFLGGLGAGYIQGLNDHIKYADLTEKGYLILDVNKTRTQGEWYYVDNINNSTATESFGDAWYTNDGSRHLTAGSTASTPPNDIVGIQAPFEPRPAEIDSVPDTTTVNIQMIEEIDAVLLGVYPNPFTNQLDLQYTTNKTTSVNVLIYDQLGRLIREQSLGEQPLGIHYATLNTSDLARGTYVLVLQTGEKRQSRVLQKE